MIVTALPPQQRTSRKAQQLVSVGETYDFEVTPTAGQRLWLSLIRGNGKWVAQTYLVAGPQAHPRNMAKASDDSAASPFQIARHALVSRQIHSTISLDARSVPPCGLLIKGNLHEARCRRQSGQAFLVLAPGVECKGPPLSFLRRGQERITMRLRHLSIAVLACLVVGAAAWSASAQVQRSPQPLPQSPQIRQPGQDVGRYQMVNGNPAITRTDPPRESSTAK